MSYIPYTGHRQINDINYLNANDFVSENERRRRLFFWDKILGVRDADLKLKFIEEQARQIAAVIAKSTIKKKY